LKNKKISAPLGKMLYGGESKNVGTSSRSESHAQGMTLVFVASAACLLAASLLSAGAGREPFAMLSSGIVEGSTGTTAVLSRRDFVPFGSNDNVKMSATAKRQL